MIRVVLVFFTRFWPLLTRLGGRLVALVLTHKGVAQVFFLASLVFTVTRGMCHFFDTVLVSLNSFQAHVMQNASGLPHSGFSVFPALAFINSIFPVSEALQLTFALMGLYVSVLSVKSIMWVYNKIPLKGC